MHIPLLLVKSTETTRLEHLGKFRRQVTPPITLIYTNIIIRYSRYNNMQFQTFTNLATHKPKRQASSCSLQTAYEDIDISKKK